MAGGWGSVMYSEWLSDKSHQLFEDRKRGVRETPPPELFGQSMGKIQSWLNQEQWGESSVQAGGSTFSFRCVKSEVLSAEREKEKQ